jgi:hypothetical protein
MVNVLEAQTVASGNFGTVIHDGEYLTSVQKIEAKIEIEKQEIKRVGTRKVGHKTMSTKGTGSIGMYKVTSKFSVAISQIMDDESAPFVTELLVKLNDPESYGYDMIRLKGVQFDNIPLANFEAGATVEEELNFTFDDFEYLHAMGVDL